MQFHIVPLIATFVLVHHAPSGWQYDHQCCGEHDCYPVACEQITSVRGGFEFHDRAAKATYFFQREKMKPSLDGECHVCLHYNNADAPLAPICVYLPVRM